MIAAFLIASLVVWLIIIYNRLVKHKNMVDEAWSGIDVQLKRRHNLIPSLVEVVKGYRDYEEKVLIEITKKRGESLNTDSAKEKGAAEAGISQGIKSLFALAENYPDLKANKSYLDLQKNLTDTEDQIQYARRYYNGAVRNLNILIDSFPDLVVARAFNFDPREYFELEYATMRKSPDVNF